jgi:7,8-dihydroneopterin aldolase/epimerase/oxygenase
MMSRFGAISGVMPAQPDPDEIHIEELELSVRLGVPDEERGERQRVTLSLRLWPRQGFGSLDDKIANAVDYAAVCEAVKEFVSTREDRLVETLAEAIAQELLSRFRIDAVEVELRKFILPDVKYVAVRIVRS